MKTKTRNQIGKRALRELQEREKVGPYIYTMADNQVARKQLRIQKGEKIKGV